MDAQSRQLIKFLLGSATFLFIGTVHGVLQVLRPIRAWLDSIGSPYGGPGHMIDPLAHAHINVVGGVVLMLMGVTYYLLPRFTGQPVWSSRLIEHTFWWTAIGVSCFYTTLLVFGIWEGHLLLTDAERIDEVHAYYGPVIATSATIMGMGFWLYFANVFMTARRAYKQS